jgi:hypothetical protein
MKESALEPIKPLPQFRHLLVFESSPELEIENGILPVERSTFRAK